MSSSEKKTVCLIDADIVLYRVAHAMDKPIELDSSIPKTPVNNGHNSSNQVYTEDDAKAQADLLINDILVACGATHYLGFITGYHNFRHTIAKFHPYKANRSKIKPYWFKFLKDYMLKEWKFILTEGIEADDALAICSKPNTIIASIDKDLLQIPGEHYNIRDDVKRLVTKEEANRLFWMQMITGDSTDTVPGIEGLGTVKAKKIIDASNHYMGDVMEAYRNKYPEDGELRFWETYGLIKMLDRKSRPLNFSIPEPIPYTLDYKLPF